MKTTHIGSLPFKDVDEAMEFTFKFDLPVLFSLPARGELMGEDVKRYLNGQPIDHWIEFKKELKNRGIKRFKFQLIGPSTGKRYFGLDRDEMLTLYKKIIIELSEDFELVFFLDEPGIETVEEIENLKSFIRELPAGQYGVHMCQKLDIDWVNQIEADFIHIDGSLYSAQELKNLKNKKMISLHENWMDITAEWIAPACGMADESDPKSVLRRLQNHQS